MPNNSTRRRTGRKGFTLVFVALLIVALIASIGIAVDIGRAYIVKGETQVFADSAALAATMELDGTAAGIERARARVAANLNKWNFNTTAFSNPEVSFAKSSTGPWESNPLNPNDYRYANVTAQAPMPLYFLPVLGGSTTNVVSSPGPMALLLFSPTMTIRASSAGGQELKTSYLEGLFPFSPYAHSTTGPHFGLELGQKYTLRWAANPRLNENVCPGDNVQRIIDLNDAGGGSERGYIEYTSAAVIRASIEGDYQSVARAIGDSVTMTGGAKQTELDALVNRINQDFDTSSVDYEHYNSARRGNGRRLVGVPINTGFPNYTIVQIGAFLLLPASEYDSGGNKPFCAEYVGAWLQGAKNKGSGESGGWVARLVR